MTVVIALMVVCLAWFTAVKPWRRAAARTADLEFRRTYARFKLVAVAKYHPAFKEFPELRRLSLDEIARIFDVERAYDDLRLRRINSELTF